MNRVEFNYNQLFAGEAQHITRLNVSAGEYKRGTLLASTDGVTYATASEIAVGKFYAICAEEKTAEGAEVVVAYMTGYFNKRVVAEATGIEITNDNAEILKTQRIFLENTIEL